MKTSQRLYRTRAVATAALLLLVGAAHAAPVAASGGKQLLDVLRNAHPGTRFDAVAPTPIPGLFQVSMGGNVAFVNRAHPRYMIFGHLFDTVSMRDLTPAPGVAAPIAPLPAAGAAAPTVDLTSLPLGDAVKEVRGAGGRVLILFTDPHCPYCRRLAPQLSRLDDVTIYHFMVAFQGREAPVAIWCAPDRVAALARAMEGNEPPPLQGKACANPIDRNATLAAKLQIRGTPSLLFGDGSRLESYVTAEEIESHFATAKRNTHE